MTSQTHKPTFAASSLLRFPTIFLLTFALLLSTAQSAFGQLARTRNTRSRAASTSTAQGRTAIDPEIKRMVAEIDPRRIERTIRRLVSLGTRNTLSAQTDPRRGIGAARDFLRDEFERISRESGGRLQVRLQSYEQPVANRIPRPTTITNVVATLPGMQAQSRDRVYVVSGHYDSMCTSPTDAECDAPGANDDASGTAAVVEMARVMARRRLDATIVFMAVAGEEQGLLGSGYFAEQAKQTAMNVEAMLTNDIIGSSMSDKGVRDDRRVRVFAEGVPSNETAEQAATRRSVGGENDSPARQLARFIKETGKGYVPRMTVQLVYRRDRYGRGGDHIPFLERGFAAVRFSEPNEDYRHQHQNVRTEAGIVYGDLPEFVDFAYVAQVARINLAALAAMAEAPARPKDVGIVTGRLTNDTDLKWTANTEPDLSHYEIVWRDTVAPYWTHSLAIGNVTNYTMRNMSKDNVFFGVRAVDREGHRSPVSYPRPVR
jgi:hypothetical protein